MTAGISRRAALVGLATAGAGAGLWFLAGREASNPRLDDPRVAAVLGWLSDPSSAARAGRRVLEQLPKPIDPQALISQLLSAPRWDGDRPVAELFAEQIREDFREGRVMRIDGWVLAESEAKLLALAQLAR